MLGKRVREVKECFEAKKKAHRIIPQVCEIAETVQTHLSEEWVQALAWLKHNWDGNVWNLARKATIRFPNGATFKTSPIINYPGGFYQSDMHAIEKWNSTCQELAGYLNVTFCKQPIIL